MLKIIGFLLLVGLLQPSAVRATELEAISNSTTSKLTSLFKNGHSPTKQELLAKPSWTCKMHGMRSRLQVYKRSQFYKFSAVENKGFINHGAQFVSFYKPTKLGASGRDDFLTDTLRISQNGKIIGELSAPRDAVKKADFKVDIPSSANPKAVVVAYTVCD